MNKAHQLREGLLLFLLLVLPFTLTGCSLPSGKKVVAPEKQQVLRVWRQPLNKKLDDKIFESMIVAFEADNPATRVEYRSFAADEPYEETVLNALASADNRPDVWEIRNDELARHLDKLAPAPFAQSLDVEKFRQRFAATIDQEMLYQGNAYGLPLGIDPLVLFINKDHFNELRQKDPVKAPQTWAEAVQLGNILTRKVGTTIFRPGLALGTTSNVDQVGKIIELLMLQLKTQMTDSANSTATFNLYQEHEENGEKGFIYPGQIALDFYKSFADSTAGQQTWDSAQPYSTRAFAEGNLSMTINYLSLGAQFKELNPKLNFTVAAVPQLPDQKRYPQGDLAGGNIDPVYTARYQALVASQPWEKLTQQQQNEKQKLSWQFIDYMTSPEILAKYTKQTWQMLPYRYEAPDPLKVETTAGSDEKDLLTPYLKTWYRGRSPRAVDRIMEEMVRSVTEVGLPAPAALDQAVEFINTLL